jgi:hypothetical protein
MNPNCSVRGRTCRFPSTGDSQSYVNNFGASSGTANPATSSGRGGSHACHDAHAASTNLIFCAGDITNSA